VLFSGFAVRGYGRLFDITQVLVIHMFLDALFIFIIPVVHNLAGMRLILRSGLCVLWNASLPVYAVCLAML